jgi:hypothetical protein
MNLEMEDNFEKQKLSGADRTRQKYENDTAGFNVRDHGVDGLVRERKCTDIMCLFVFFAFIVGMGVCSGYGFKHGQISKLLAPLDGDNKFCGVDVGYELYPHLVLTDFAESSAKAIFKSGVCSKACPKTGEKVEFVPTSRVSSTTVITVNYDSRDVLNYCLPKSGGAVEGPLKKGFENIKAALLQNPAG